jgi:serine/threonine protein kinase
MSTTIVLDNIAYNIIAFLGKGSFGSVVLAENEKGHRVAIKRIYDESWINNNEISALLRLNHPGIIKLHGYHCLDDAHYIIMDYVAGGDLFTYLNRSACDERTAKIMFRQLVLAIKAAHRRNIYHGDLRLENILIDYDKSQIILADWGFASFSKLRRVKQIPYGGDCIEYKPPEFFTAKVISNAMLDVWMLGIVLYAMMTQKFPFIGDNITADIINCKYEISDIFSPDLRDLISKIFQPEDKRISLLGVLYHPWLKCESVSVRALLDP